uniref:Putative head-tail connector n=1 Tax=viral metagenome TaxID=1070528 RepID=A0A6M3J9F2_9ZZZZ
MRFDDLHWALSTYAAPSVEPLTVAEAKTHLRLSSSAGEPAPSALTAALASPAAPGNVTAGAHRYLATFVTADGETEAGTVSSIVTVADAGVNGQVSLTAIPLGGSLVTARNLYRTAAGGSTYLKLAQLANNTATTYTDNIADGSLGAEAPSTNTTLDPYLTVMVKAARQMCESATSRALITQTLDLTLDRFPSSTEPIRVPRLPLVSAAITYTDEDGASQTWTAGLYSVDTSAGRILPAYGEVYPSTRTGILNAVTVRFVAGYGATSASVPSAILSAMKLLIGHWYEHRESTAAGNLNVVPQAVDALLDCYKASF